jgi:photosystem II stability/assembly factor-like uncharacterized protein
MRLQRFMSLFIIICASTSIFAQGNWELVFPWPTSNQMTSLYFIDNETGWSVGEYGTILKTTDGENWEIQEIPWTFDLSDVHFPNEDTGYAIGTDGFIIKTTDGGETWNPLENQYSNNLNRIRFRDENTGWTIGEKGLILHTVDGGVHWNLESSNKKENLLGIDFIGTTGGVCVVGDNNTILITQDDGQTWESVLPDTTSSCSFKDVYFLDDQHGWIGGGEYIESWIMSYISYVLLQTEDGGETWTDREGKSYSYSDQGVSGGGGEFNGDLQQIYFYNTTTAIGLIEIDNSFMGSLGNIAMRTSNAGKNWSGRIINGVQEDYLGKGRFSVLDEERLICTGYGGDFRFSEDQGRSWYLPDYQPRYWERLIVGNHGRLLTHQYGVMNRGKNDRCFCSSDYGTTWREFEPQYLDTNNQPINILYFDGHDNFIHNRDTLWLAQRIHSLNDTTQSVFISTDFGKTYHEIRRGISSRVNTFLTPDTMIGYKRYDIESSPGKFDAGIQISYSFDGGMTVHTYKSLDLWNKFSFISAFPILDINAHYFLNGRRGFLVGSDGNIVGTSDAGRSWTNIYSGVVEDLHDITFINKQTGFVVGDFGRILKTLDGGITWKKTNSGTQEDIFCIGFINDYEGWVGAENGLRYTTDGGETWKGVPLRYSHGQIRNLAFDDAGNGYAYTGTIMMIFLKNNPEVTCTYCEC